MYVFKAILSIQRFFSLTKLAQSLNWAIPEQIPSPYCGHLPYLNPPCLRNFQKLLSPPPQPCPWNFPIFFFTPFGNTGKYGSYFCISVQLVTDTVCKIHFYYVMQKWSVSVIKFMQKCLRNCSTKVTESGRVGIYAVHYTCGNVDLNLMLVAAMTSGFIFQIIDSLMYTVSMGELDLDLTWLYTLINNQNTMEKIISYLIIISLKCHMSPPPKPWGCVGRETFEFWAF